MLKSHWFYQNRPQQFERPVVKGCQLQFVSVPVTFHVKVGHHLRYHYIHGPKFRLLNAQEKQDLVKLHKNLGHPDPLRLAHHLKEAGAHEHVIEAAKEYVCDACVETSKFRHQRPAKLHDPREFNELLGIDRFYWTGRGGFQVMVFHCIDEASLFHLGRRLQNRHLEYVVPVFKEMWMSWAGHQPVFILTLLGNSVLDTGLIFCNSKT